MDIPAFVAKWRASTAGEAQAAKLHFVDLCQLVNHRTPDVGPASTFTFEKPVTKVSGAQGFVDVWYKGHFAIEYKSKGGDLAAAYQQLLQYRDNLDNPPLLIVCDINRIVIRTNFTGFTTRTITIVLDDFLTNSPIGDTGHSALEVIRRCFNDPESLRPEETTEKLTEKVAESFRRIALSLKAARSAKYDEETRDYPRLYEDMAIARFLCKLVFCMFASDVDLLPKNIISEIIDHNRSTSAKLATALERLFVEMRAGGTWGSEEVRHFNGGLFEDPSALEIDSFNVAELREADQLDWSDVEPSIFGTLFERIIDERQRKALGKHYTSRTDIETLVEPVIMWPLRQEWDEVAAKVDALMAPAPGDVAAQAKATGLLNAFVERLGRATILDPACGSGNFLYVAFEKLKLLEREAIARAITWGLPQPLPRVHPSQLYGIELNEYAHQLASTVVWIGYLQWKRRQGDYDVDDPVLMPLEDNIRNTDAILAWTPGGAPYEPDWPVVEFIIGNPPFLGGKRLRTELGDAYVNAMFHVWDGRVRREADFCCYWHEKARGAISAGNATRAGLLATQAIRGGANRTTLERIKESGDIFFAESDRKWYLDGAAVQVSMVGFDDGRETRRVLDGHSTEGINANLTSRIDLASAHKLAENGGISFMGDTKVGEFEIPPETAKAFLTAPNPHGKPNSDVVRPWLNGIDVTQIRRDLWIVDFPPGMSEPEAALYELPFQHVKSRVKPERDRNNRRAYAERWWIHAEARPTMRAALAGRERFIATPNLTKYRFFVWLPKGTIPDHQLIVFARNDDYFFGVLHSSVHELWARATGTQLREAESGFRYTPTTCFETFPFPWPPGHEPEDSPLVTAIAEAARELNTLRESWLNPPESIGEPELKKRTLTNLYNERVAGEMTWLDIAHRKLDEAVFAAYGWPEKPADLPDQDILARLLKLNLEREPA